MKLNLLFQGESKNLDIRSISSDSRNSNSEGIFFCIRGLRSDSHDFIPQAIENGAVCIVHDRNVDEYKADYPSVTFIEVKDTRVELARVSEIFYGSPSSNMIVYGVTGTNGKTTTAYILYQILSKFERSAYNGTAGTIIAGEESPYVHLTTPDTIDLTKIFKRANDMNVSSMAMEVSSHALDMKRAHGIDFDIAISTNLSRDHLDYHGSMEKYLDAKCELFRMIKPSGKAIINVDDDYAKGFIDSVENAEVFTYGKDSTADYRFSDIELSPEGTKFNLTYQEKTYSVVTNLISEINVYNLCAAIAAIHQGGRELQDVILGARDIPFEIGRFQYIPSSKYSIIVDYAHTPGGFEKIYEFTDSIRKGGKKLISVFGAAGKRDKGKRPIMGKIAAEHSDLLILCEEDSRDEAPSEISKDIAKGAEGICDVVINDDRESAIRLAIEKANTGDIIVILGKGVENFLDREDRSDNWDGDHIIAAKYAEL